MFRGLVLVGVLLLVACGGGGGGGEETPETTPSLVEGGTGSGDLGSGNETDDDGANEQDPTDEGESNNDIEEGNGESNLEEPASSELHSRPDAVATDSAGVIYLLSTEDKLIYRWVSRDGKYLEAVQFGSDSSATVVDIALVETHGRIYLGYDSGTITFIDLAANHEEQQFAQLATQLKGLVSVGDFLLAQADAPNWGADALYHHIFNVEGMETDERVHNYVSPSYAWNPVTSRGYFLRNGRNPNYLQYEEIDQATGQVMATGDMVHAGYDSMRAPLIVSTDGSRVIFGTGDMHDADDLTWIGSVGSFNEAIWLQSGEILAAAEDGSGFKLERRNPEDAEILDIQEFAGNLVALTKVGPDVLIISEDGNGPIFTTYSPSNDMDGDGVENTTDAFPNEPSASIDTDGDGYPDTFNDSYDDASGDSPLILDAFPEDAACWLPEHSDALGGCNLLATMLPAAPDKVFSDGEGILYLFNSDHRIVYRWSSLLRAYLNPIHLGRQFGLDAEVPVDAVYAPVQERLYIGYRSGRITFIDLSGSLDEQFFGHVSKEVEALLPAGNYLLAQIETGNWATRYVFSESGQVADVDDGYYSPEAHDWDETASRLYYLSEGVSPADLYYVDINQDSGQVSIARNTPYHGEYTISPPIHLSPENAHILLGSGDIYRTDDLSWVGAIEPLAAAVWLGSNEILASGQLEGSFRLTHWDTDIAQKIDVQEYPGDLLALVQSLDTTIVVRWDGERVRLDIHEPNPDSDSDGVANEDDAFPLDPAASQDSDQDGYPDAWNPGYGSVDSTTGLVLDAFPTDSVCWLAEHNDGSGACDYSATMPQFVPQRVIADNDGNVYLFSEENQRIYRWSETQKKYLSPIDVGFSSGFITESPKEIAYSGSHGRIYLGYESGKVNFIEIDSDLEEMVFSSIQGAVRGMKEVGDFLLVNGSLKAHYIFDENGSLMDGSSWNGVTPVYAWNPVNSRVYFFANGQPDDLHYEEIDPISGAILKEGNSPYHGAGFSDGPLLISPQGQHVLNASGEFFDATELRWQGSIERFRDAQWLDDGQLVTLADSENKIKLTRLDADLLYTLEESEIFGNLLAFVRCGAKTLIVTDEEGEFRFTEYIPVDDTDMDGVANLDDAFPLDIAASTDVDGDGYPGDWNSGYSQADSSSGLALDAFPEDTSCWQAGHGDAEGLCDYAATLPNFTPEEIVAGDDGVLYLFASGLGRVYRWSAATGSYLDPLPVGGVSGARALLPTKMTYSSEHQRLYFGYQNGVISYIALPAVSRETLLTTVWNPVYGIAAAGNFLIVDSYSREFDRYILDSFGMPADAVDGIYTGHWSGELTWDPNRSRLYYLRSGSPSDLHYMDIDPDSGVVLEQGETPYHGDHTFRPPIRVSVSGGMATLGSGGLYDSETLNWQGTVGAFDDALWLESGELVTVRQQSSAFYLSRFDNSLARVVEELTQAGEFLAIRKLGTTIVMISRSDDHIVFTEYVPNSDSDNDGVVNSEDDYPLDPAASADSDGDGYVDGWNPGYSEQDSTDGLELDIFPHEKHCWLASHDDGSGQCDFAATMPEFRPDTVVSDGEDQLFLFSPENLQIYRWSVSQQKFQRPIDIGYDNGLTVTIPLQMAYAPINGRLYLGYESGEITFIDVGGDLSEQPFASIPNEPKDVAGIVALEDYVLVQNMGGSVNVHYLFDSEGELSDSADRNFYSREFAWNAENSRVYFFQDRRSPNDLRFEDIDLDAGLITGSGETPYHSSTNIRLPIRIVDNGKYVLLGSGKMYDAQTLELSDLELPAAINDAVAFSEMIVTSRTDGEKWFVEIFRHLDFKAALSLESDFEVLGIFRAGDNLVIMESVDGSFKFSDLFLGDSDLDGMPEWWESLYGLSDDDELDAMVDSDFDGLSNLEEYVSGTDPTVEDSDGDGLNDFEEVTVYFTLPGAIDSDDDLLSDGDEIYIYETQPMAADSDGDFFSDADEIYIYETNPNDSLDVPAPLTSLSESFERSSLPVVWQGAAANDSDWKLVNGIASDGSRSIGAGEISYGESSSIEFTAVFSEGTLSFDALLEPGGCCHALQVFVNGGFRLAVEPGGWNRHSIFLGSGEHTITWQYEKYGIDSLPTESTYIDNVTFTP